MKFVRRSVPPLVLVLAAACGQSGSHGSPDQGGTTAGAGGTVSDQGGQALGGGSPEGGQSLGGSTATAGNAGVTAGGGAAGGAGGVASSGAGAVAGGDGGAAGNSGLGSAGGGQCAPSAAQPVGCGDAIEGAFLARFSVTAEDNAVSTLSETPGISGQKALRLVTASGFLVTLRFAPETALAATNAQELRLLLRAKNTNTGWQGNVPVITLEDGQGKRRSYTPAGVSYPTDGTTWAELRVPLAGGHGYQVSGDVIDFEHVQAVELTADTWESGFTIDVDGLGFVAPGAACAVTCESDCHGRGSCSAQQLGCVCEVGASGAACASCRAGFALKNGHCALEQDGDFDYWPNAVSQTNGDAWLQAHHQSIKTLAPRVLALNFVNPSAPDQVQALVRSVIAGFKEGSRPLGAADAAAPPGLAYELLGVVDLRDGVAGRAPAPNGYAYDNSTLFPRRAPGAAGTWRFDYAALFSASFAKYYGVQNPDEPGSYLDLCQLVESGRLHELWIVGSGDVASDVNAAEVLEHKQRYDAGRNPLAGSFDPCAGNGCFDADVPRCARSIRIGFVNYNRGPGCYLHSQGHGLESTARRHVLPALSDWFLPFAGFDLDARHGLPAQSFYELLGDQNHAEYPAPDQLRLVRDGTTTTASGYVASCGNVHFPPNAGNHYDYDSKVAVRSDCADFGRNVGSCRMRMIAPVTSTAWSGYDQLSPDCGGAFLVYWYQHMPGFHSGQQFDDGREMLSVWPFLFY